MEPVTCSCAATLAVAASRDRTMTRRAAGINPPEAAKLARVPLRERGCCAVVFGDRGRADPKAPGARPGVHRVGHELRNVLHDDVLPAGLVGRVAEHGAAE